MGYNAELAQSQADTDAEKHKEFMASQKAPAEKKIKAKKGMTKEE